MVSQEFVKRILNQKVHVDYFDEKTAQLVWVEGTFTELIEDKDEVCEAIEITSETDLDRIPMRYVKKIYLKE